ncbi:MAG: DUF3365 domain-containing protein [Cyanobacteria bacterium P01_A01_bin.116]
MLSSKLSTKFSLLLVMVFLLGSALTVFTFSQHLNRQAEQAVKERAEILISTLQATRNYTQERIQPALEENSRQGLENFRPEAIPNFAARTIFSAFRQQDPAFQDFSYKEAALNPTNPADLVDGFEAQVIKALKAMPSPQEQGLSGYRTLNGTNLFYLARPLFMNDASCLTCHGDPSQAPPSLIKMYGSDHGFGWQLNELVAAQMVYVPADTIFARSRDNLWTVSKIFLSIFAAFFVVINLLLWRTVLRPLAILTHSAKQISSFSSHPPATLTTSNLAILTRRQDEPGQLARAFEYMVSVLGQREQDLQTAVQARTQSLRTEMHERQTAQDALQTYNHTINHDLRNLVMGVSMVVQGVLRQAANTSQSSSPIVESPITESPVTIEPTALTLIQKSCDRQLNLMNSLVEVRSAEIWRTVLHTQPLELQTLTTELANTYTAKFQATSATQKFTLATHIPSTLPRIQADPSQLKRVFENLINNALKYNPDGVDITISAAVENHTIIRCAVADNGIGIHTADTQDLFKIYARGQTDRKILGDGVGLYICRQIINAHGGNIGIEAPKENSQGNNDENSPIGGATFWFTLPIRQ